MEMVEKRVCPVCGSAIVGRKDKVYCCNDCRSYHHNMRSREKEKRVRRNDDMAVLKDNALFLLEKKSLFLLKFIVLLSGICKIISIFGLLMLKGKRDRSL